MKIVVISDTHGSHRDVLLPDGDVLIHAGDVVNSLMSNLEQQRCKIEDLDVWFGQLIANKKFKKIFCIAGNHDFPFARMPFATLKNAEYLENTSFEYEGVIFHGSPNQLPFYGVFTLGEECLERVYSKTDKVDVLITHGPPFGILDEPYNSKNKNAGSKALLSFVERVKPKLHCFGHIHYSYGQLEKDGTTFFNASQSAKITGRMENKPLIYKLEIEDGKFKNKI
jgi:Icc-related predicted phosphoesterase